jgi:hypothetical protein
LPAACLHCQVAHLLLLLLLHSKALLSLSRAACSHQVLLLLQGDCLQSLLLVLWLPLLLLLHPC